MDCTLEKLSQAQITEPLAFLNKLNCNYEIDEKEFSCCFGSGLKPRKKMSQGVSYCPIKQRLFYTKQILNKFYQTWGITTKIPELKPEQFKTYWQWLVCYKHRLTYKGYAFKQENLINKPSTLWTVALLASWRFGFPVHIHTSGKHQLNDIFLFHEKLVKDKKTNPIVLWEQPTGLWNLKSKEEFSFIISWCEKSLWPLWVCLSENSESTHLAQKSKTMKDLHKRIKMRKEKNPLFWLSEDSRSKLESLCKKI
ncbi:MAG: hypothetical protein CMP11_02535 [Zetaproteobacteria bacterium]|nr:hypothetical protein [Pseudobdellovibrionaceae bacterium]